MIWKRMLSSLSSRARCRCGRVHLIMIDFRAQLANVGPMLFSLSLPLFVCIAAWPLVLCIPSGQLYDLIGIIRWCLRSDVQLSIRHSPVSTYDCWPGYGRKGEYMTVSYTFNLFLSPFLLEKGAAWSSVLGIQVKSCSDQG